MKTTSTSTGTLIDTFGTLKASAAELDAQLKEIKAELIARAVEKAEGDLFRISISNTVRDSIDWKAIALALAKKSDIGEKAFDNLVARHTGLTEITTVRCSSRITGAKDPA